MKNKYCSRSDRLAELIHKELSSVILKFCQDPRLEHLTITNVKLTLDLSIAQVYFTNFMHEPKSMFTEKHSKSQQDLPASKFAFKSTLKILKNASNFLRFKLAEQISLRKVPEIRFFYDENLDYGMKIESLLSKITEV